MVDALKNKNLRHLQMKNQSRMANKNPRHPRHLRLKNQSRMANKNPHNSVLRCLLGWLMKR